MAAALFGCMAANAADIVPLSTKPLYTQPQGEVADGLWWSSKGYSSSWAGLEAFTEDGLVAKTVTNGDSIYIYNPLSQLKSSTWIGGKLNGNVLTVSLPLAIYEEYDEVYYLSALKLQFSSDGATYVPVDDNKVTFTKDGDNLTLNEGQVIGLIDQTGDWYGFADSAISITKPQLTAVKAPASARRQTYLVSVVDDYDQESITPVNFAFDGNDVYMTSPATNDSTVWAKGKLDGDSISFPDNQYLGIDSADNHFTFLRSGKAVTETDPDWGEYTTYDLANEPIVFKYSAIDGSMSNASAFMVCRSNKVADNLAVYVNASLTPFNEIAATPADPEIISYSPADSDYSNTAYFAYQIPTEDEDGNYILPSKMYYEVFTGKNPDEPLTFTPSDYTALTKPMTQIPLNFTDGQDINNGYINLHNVYSDSIGIQVFYTGGGETRSSAKIWYSYSDVNNGIESVTPDADTKSVKYFDLSGRTVAPNTKGILIRKSIDKSGRVTTTKVIK